MSSVARPPIDLPSKRISPSVRHMPESERRVVVLPAPFAPSSVVMPPSSTLELEAEQHLRRRRR